MKLRKLEEKRAENLERRFHDHPLLLTCQSAFHHYMADMSQFDFTSEDLFLVAAEVIDTTFEDPASAPQYLEGLWDNVKIELKTNNSVTPPQEDLNTVCKVLFYVVAATLRLHWKSYYNTELVSYLYEAVAQKGLFDDVEEQRRIISNLCTHAEALEDWINKYEDSRIWLTDEIEACLRKRKLKPKEEACEKQQKDYSRYSFELIPTGRFKGNDNKLLDYLYTELKDKHFIADYDIKLNGELAHIVSDKAGKNKLIFNSVFSGKDTDYHILWTGTKVELRYFLSQLKERNVLSWKTGPGIWQVTRNRIWWRNKEGEIVQFGEMDFDKGNKPANTTELDKILDLIAPVARKSKDMIGDEIRGEFEDYSNYESTHKNNRGEKLVNGFRDTTHKAQE